MMIMSRKMSKIIIKIIIINLQLKLVGFHLDLLILNTNIAMESKSESEPQKPLSFPPKLAQIIIKSNPNPKINLKPNLQHVIRRKRRVKRTKLIGKL